MVLLEAPQAPKPKLVTFYWNYLTLTLSSFLGVIVTVGTYLNFLCPEFFHESAWLGRKPHCSSTRFPVQFCTRKFETQDSQT